MKYTNIYKIEHSLLEILPLLVLDSKHYDVEFNQSVLNLYAEPFVLNKPWYSVDINDIQSLLYNDRVTFYACSCSLLYKIFSINHINYEQRIITPKFDKTYNFNSKQHMFDTMRVEICAGIKPVYMVISSY